MATIEIKKAFHELIDSIEDDAYLKDLYNSVAVFIGQRTLVIDDTSPETLQMLNQSLQQAQEGKTITTEQLQKEIKQWLSK